MIGEFGGGASTRWRRSEPLMSRDTGEACTRMYCTGRTIQSDNTVQYSAAQYSAIQYKTVQICTNQQIALDRTESDALSPA